MLSPRIICSLHNPELGTQALARGSRVSTLSSRAAQKVVFFLFFTLQFDRTRMTNCGELKSFLRKGCPPALRRKVSSYAKNGFNSRRLPEKRVLHNEVPPVRCRTARPALVGATRKTRSTGLSQGGQRSREVGNSILGRVPRKPDPLPLNRLIVQIKSFVHPTV